MTHEDKVHGFRLHPLRRAEGLGIVDARTKPGHAGTNGFVERLKGTIAHEHGRVAFRRRYFTWAHQRPASLEAFLGFHNEERAKGSAPRDAPRRRCSGAWPDAPVKEA